jgi:hypothetical protein
MTAPKIDVLPPAPSRANPTAFAAESDAVLAAQADFVTQANNLGTYVEVQANTVGPSLSYAEQAQAAAAAALIYRNDAAAAVTYQDLAAFALSKSITMVDGLVYRTANDSDGGAWRERTQGTSWYNETLDTATRGSTRKFPSVAIIIAESGKVTIFNGDDPACPMWMVFSGYIRGNSSASTVRSVYMLNGEMNVGSNGGVHDYNSGLARVQFIKNFYHTNRGPSVDVVTVSDGNIVNRNIETFVEYATGPRLVSGFINDVTMVVRPNAPIDHTTGLQITTIAVGTDGGVSVINNDRTVTDSSETRVTEHVDFGPDGSLYYAAGPFSQLLNVVFPDTYLADGFSSDVNYNRTLPKTITSGRQNILGGAGDVRGINPIAVGTIYGLTFITPNFATPANGMVANATSTYNTGHMVGDIKGAYLSSTDITSLVNGDTDADRSVNANGLTVTGTINRAPVATNADLVGYSGWSASNYMGQAYNTGLNFGTGEFSTIVNLKMAANSATEVIFERDSPTTAQRITLAVSAAGLLVFTVDDGTTTRTATGSTAVDIGTWQEIVAYYDGAGGVYIYLNGTLEASATGSALLTMTNTAAILRVGIDVQGANPLTNGSLALLRPSATAPSAEQSAEIYHDERSLFQPGAQSTIYGASDAVTAIAHDKGTDLLHVGTSAGRSVFSGLQRVSNTTVAVPGVISASNDLVIEG